MSILPFPCMVVIGEKIMKKLLLITLIINYVILLSGCNNIFQQKKDKYAQVELEKENLKEDVYYIKNGTRFVKVHPASQVSVKDSATGQETQLCFLTKDYKTVPTLYKGEIIAIASKTFAIPSLSVTRFRELGYSFGFFGAAFTKDGYIYFDNEKNSLGKSDSTKYFKDTKSTEIRIETINESPVSAEMLTSTGVMNCLTENGCYDITFYSGTYYMSGQITSDTFTLQEYEYYTLKNSSDTKNGYLSFSMPEDAKSGWYYINGAGLFKYVADEKGVDESKLDYNEPYYTEEKSQDAAYAQKFSTSLNIRMNNIMFVLYYDPKTINDVSNIDAKVYAPDDSVYEMDLNEEKHYLYCSLAAAMPGKWMMYVNPDNLIITDMKVVSTKNQQAVTEESYPIIVEEDKTNFCFSVKYTGKGEIYGIVIFPDGTTYDLVNDINNHTLQYTAAFIPADGYTVKIYHYTDTNVDSVDVIENTKTDSDIITVTE